MAGAEGDDLFTEWHRRWFKAKSAAKPIVLCDACAAILGIDADPAALEALAAIPRDEGGIGGGRGLIAEMDRLRREGTAEERAAFAEVVTAPAAVAAAD